MYRTVEEKRAKVMSAGKPYFKPLEHVEFKCPLCGGVASICLEGGRYTVAECHA